MKFIPTNLQDAFLIQLNQLKDERGFFSRSFCSDEFKDNGLEINFIQQNISHSKKINTLRGMHYQTGKFAEAKYIRCHSGVIFDVIIDLRTDSSTYLNHQSFKLTADNFDGLYVPRGFAHGFMTLTSNVVVSYLVSSPYDGSSERAIRWDDPTFNIKWPATTPLISEKDSSHNNFNPSTQSLNRLFLETPY